MKRAFSIFMLTALMLPPLTKIGILIDFKINQDFIAEVLCINRDEPMTMCNGNCYLSEQLQKAEEQEKNQAPTSQKERMEVVYYFFQSALDFPPSATHYTNQLNTACVKGFYASSFIAEVFHPPKLRLI